MGGGYAQEKPGGGTEGGPGREVVICMLTLECPTESLLFPPPSHTIQEDFLFPNVKCSQ